MLNISNNPPKIISFLDFCERFSFDNQFKANMSPIIAFLEDLKVVELDPNNENSDDIDFRWTTLIVFADYLRKLIKQMDRSKVVRLFEDTQNYAADLFKKSKKLERYIKGFDEHYDKKA